MTSNSDLQAQLLQAIRDFHQELSAARNDIMNRFDAFVPLTHYDRDANEISRRFDALEVKADAIEAAQAAGQKWADDIHAVINQRIAHLDAANATARHELELQTIQRLATVKDELKDEIQAARDDTTKHRLDLDQTTIRIMVGVGGALVSGLLAVAWQVISHFLH